ncbi:MAG: hypothetical protein HKM87_06240 [Ignavibacteriaceae bacterium]|nr:hypothetical protein [Ignavibacteriaceae bacterium]
MKKFFILLLILISVTTVYSIGIETEESDQAIYNPFKPNPQQNRWYYGGNVGFRFWNNYLYLSVQPLVGYKVTPKFSVGGKLAYSYLSDKRINPTFNSHNFGGSIFTRYRVVPQFYLHGEFVYASFDQITGLDLQSNKWMSERVWVPFLLLGGGVSQMVGSNVWIFAEVLVDVLNDKNSPYKEWDPFVSFGAGVGF